MPIKSSKQYNFMQMIAHNPNKKTTKGIGPSPDVAEEMIHKTPPSDRSKFAKMRSKQRG